MDFKITEKQLNPILSYLASRPYAEVYQLVSMLSTLDRFEEKVELKQE